MRFRTVPAARRPRLAARRGAVALLAASLIPGAFAAGQEPEVQRIDGRIRCAPCELQVDEIASLGSLDDSLLIGDVGLGVVRRSDGSFVVAAGLKQSLIVYGPNGEFRSAMGRIGEGPEELTTVLGLESLPDGRVAVVQPGRLTVFSPGGLVDQVATARFINSGPGLHVAPDGDVLFTRSATRSGRRGDPFRVFDADLVLKTSFGTVRSEDESCSRCSSRPASWSPLRPDHFWAARQNRFELQLWHEDGRLVRSMQVEESPWFEAWDRATRRTNDGRTVELGVSRITHVWQDSDGLLWVMARVPSEDWEPVADGMPSLVPVGETPPEIADYLASRWDTVVEVMDPDAGAVLARHRIDGSGVRRVERSYDRPVAAELFARKVQDASGLVRYEILRLTLER